jgi:acyl-CoA thioester hydrolase
MIKPYFKTGEGQPSPLRIRIKQKVRFEEVDSLGIVWHGRYASYFEDARVAFGEKYGIGYMDFYANGVVAPIKQMHFDYHRPLRFGDKMTIEAVLHWSDAARLNFEFILRNGNGELSTTGYTIQMMLDLKENILVVLPPFYRKFLDNWKAGVLK